MPLASTSTSRPLLYDEWRKMWVVATPEEVVRQALVHQMVGRLGYPKELIALEKELKELPHLKAGAAIPAKRRLDIVCFARGIHPEHPLFPLLLIECKDKAISDAAKEQVIGYNDAVGAPFVAVAAQEGVEVGAFDAQAGVYRFMRTLPPFENLVKHARSGLKC